MNVVECKYNICLQNVTTMKSKVAEKGNRL